MFTPPRRLMELALEADRVKAYTETGMPLSRVIQQAIYCAETNSSIADADLAGQILEKRDIMAAKRSAEQLGR